MQMVMIKYLMKILYYVFVLAKHFLLTIIQMKHNGILASYIESLFFAFTLNDLFSESQPLVRQPYELSRVA